VVGPDDLEVPVVERRDLHDAVPFGGSYDGRVDAAQRQVVVFGDKFGDPDQIGRVDGLDCEVARREVSEEPDLWLPAQPCGQEVHDFGDDESWDQQRSWVCLEEFQAGRVMSVVGVDVGVQRT
jgi:hypothetical protein